MANWFEENDPAKAAKADTVDWFAANDPDTTSLVKQHVRGKKGTKQKENPLRVGARVALQALPAALGTAGEFGGAALGGLGAGVAAAPTIPVAGPVGEAAAIPAGIYGGRVAGATLGASTGKLIQNALGPMVGMEQQDLMHGVGQEALLQGGLTAVGIPAFSKVGLGPLARFTGAGEKVGQGVMELAGKVTPAGAQTMIQNGIAATKAGTRLLDKKLGEAGEYTMKLLGQATRRGVRYQVADLATEAERPLMQDILARGLRPDAPEAQELRAFRDAWIRKHQNLVTPLELKRSIQNADADLAGLYNRIGKGGQIKGADLAEERFLKSYADEARNRLRQLPEQGVKKIGGVSYPVGVQQAEEHTKSLIDLRKELLPEVKDRASPIAQVLRNAGPRAAAAGVGATIGGFGNESNRPLGALEGGLTGLLLTNPWLASQIAQALSNRGGQQAAGQLLRPLGSAVNQ